MEPKACISVVMLSLRNPYEIGLVIVEDIPRRWNIENKVIIISKTIE